MTRGSAVFRRLSLPFPCLAVILFLAGCSSGDSEIENRRRSKETADWGVKQARAGKMEEAAAAFRDAAKLDPDNSDALFNLGNALIMLGREGDAIVPLQELTRLVPEDAVAWARLGQTHRNLAQFNEAVAALERATRLAPDNADLRRSLGECYAIVEEPEKAFEEYREAARIDPGDALDYLHMCASLERYGDVEEARGLLQKGLEIAAAAGDESIVYSLELEIENRVPAGSDE